MKQGKGLYVAALLCIAAGTMCLIGSHWMTVEVPQNGPSFTADLNRDGKEEQITVDLSKAEEQGYAELHVLDRRGTELFQADLSTSHMGEGSFFLYRKGGEDYLLKYVPYMSTGLANYWYEVIYFDEDNKEVSVMSDNVEFSDNLSLWNDVGMDVDEMVAFADEINGLLDESVLLVSTIGGRLQYSEDEDNGPKYVERYDFLNMFESLFLPGDDLHTRLTKFRDEKAAQYEEYLKMAGEEAE